MCGQGRRAAGVGVHPPVLDQVADAAERVAAVVALVGLDAGVQGAVGYQALAVTETFSAHLKGAEINALLVKAG